MAKAKNFGFKIGKDNGGIPNWLTTNFCNGFANLMSANTEVVIQVPSGRYLAIFQKTVGTNLWIVQDENPVANSITIPTNDTFIETEMELSKPGVTVIPGMYLHFKCSEATYLKVNFYDPETSQR